MSHLETIFNAAIDRSSEAERNAFLDVVCGDDSELRREVEGLLIDYNEGQFLENRLLEETTAPSPASSRPEKLHSMIGPYKLLEKIGEGGMGSVYVAEQTKPVRRIVALKIIKPGMDTEQVVARFEAERQALALMNHPNIAKVLDAGATESGRPYFVMELVKGIPITEYCDTHKLTTRERLELLVTICDALQHAHQKGIIHRDLKPGNLLVELHDVRPVPKVVDFGIAKSTNQRLTERTLYTNFTQMIGTPLYMSPEQAQLSGLDVDTRSDVYSLGVLLYELITGTTPFTKESMNKISFDEIRRRIQSEDPPRPSDRISTLKAEAFTTLTDNQRADPRKLQQQVRNELDWVVMKALEKDRARRYQSATAMSEDIRRYLDDEPVQACPPSMSYRLKKLTRRYRAPLATAAALLVMLLAATAISIRYAVVAEGSRQEAVEARTFANSQKDEVYRKNAEVEEHLRLAVSEKTNATSQRDEKNRALYIADMRLASTDLEANNIARVHETLFKHESTSGSDDLRSWEWFYLLSGSQDDSARLFDASKGGGATWSPNGELIAYARHDGQIVIWDVNNEKVLRQFSGGDRVTWSTDGKFIASRKGVNEIVIRRLFDDTTIPLVGHQNDIESIAWSPNGRRIASSSRDSSFRIWDADSGECQLVKKGGTFVISDISWSPTGEQVVTSSKWAEGSTGLRIWNASTGDLELELKEGGFFNRVAFSGDGEFVLAGTMEGELIVVRIADRSEIRKVAAHSGAINAVEISPDGETFATGGVDGLIHIWSYPDASKHKTFRGHDGPVATIDWSTDGKRLVSTDSNGCVMFWEINLNPTNRVISNPANRIKGFAWRDNDCLNVYPSVHSLLTYTTTSNDPIAHEQILDNERVDVDAVRNGDQAIMFLSQFKKSSSKLPPRINHEQFIWSDDGSRFAACWSRKETLVPDVGADEFVSGHDELNRLLVIGVWDVQSLTKLANFEFHVSSYAMAFSPDARQLAVFGPSKSDGNACLSLIDLEIGKASKPVFESYVWDLDFSSAVSWCADGKRIAFSTTNGMLYTLDSQSGRLALSSKVHHTALSSLSWSHDGRRIAVGTASGEMKIVDSETGQELLTLEDLGAKVVQICWSPDGRQLAALGLNGVLNIWDATRGYQYTESADYSRARSHQALIRAGNSKASEALTILDSILNTEQENVKALRLRAYTRRQSNQRKLASEDFRRISELHSTDWEAWNQRGIAEIDQGRYSAAIESFTIVIEHGSQWTSAFRNNRAVAYLKLEQYANALDDLRISFDEFKDLEAGSVLADLSGRLYGQVAYEDVCRELLEKLPKSTDDSGKRWVLMRLQAKLPEDMLERGLELAEELYSKLDQFPEAGRWKAYSLYRLERYLEAHEILSKSTDPILNAPSVWCWFWMAMTCQKIGNSEDARYWLRKANVEADRVLDPVAKPGWMLRNGLPAMRDEATKLVMGEN